MTRSRLLDAATNAPDPRDARIAELERQLAALAPQNQAERALYEKRLGAAKRDEDERTWVALPDTAARLRCFHGIVSDYEAERFVQVIGRDHDALVDLVRHARGADRERLRDRILRTAWRDYEAEATADDALPGYVRVTSAGSRGSEQQEIDEDGAAQYEAAGLKHELLWWGNGRIGIRGFSLYDRKYRIVAADEWRLRLSA